MITAAIDHSSILRPATAQQEHEVISVGVSAQGLIDEAALVAACNEQTHLVCLQFANNELGTQQDIPRLSQLVREHAPQALIHCDACQGAGKVAIDAISLGVDFLQSFRP